MVLMGPEASGTGWRWSPRLAIIAHEAVATNIRAACREGGEELVMEPYRPTTKREHIVSGRIRSLMEDGTEVEAAAGDTPLMPPGHRGWVIGVEACARIDR